MLQILLALLAGILTIAAPCILLPLPILLGSSVGQSSKTRPLFITLGFVVTFATLGIALNFLVQHLGLSANALRDGAAALLLLFGFFMIWPTPFENLASRANSLITKAGQTGQRAGSGNWGGFVLGLIIGIVWAPCAGPILGSILTLIARQQNLAYATVLLVAYAVGAGIPMLLIAYGGQYITTKVRGIAQYATKLQQVFGVIIILLAAAIYFQYDTVVEAKLTAAFPSLGIEQSLVSSNTDNSSTTNDRASNQTTAAPMPHLANQGLAPDFTGISHWLNSDPLTLQQLRGKVVLVDFWTYSCINCIRTLPYVTKWYDTYKDRGFVVVGVHTPEFGFEKDSSNVANAIKQFGIHYPVAQDNEYGTWNAYNNQYWPAEYLIDQKGNIVRTHFGEGEYDQTENAIRELLGIDKAVAPDDGQDLSSIQSPEMYFGTNRLENLVGTQTPSSSPTMFTLPNDLPLNQFALSGTWQFDPEKAVLTSGSGMIQLTFNAPKVNIVAASTSPVTVEVYIDGNKTGTVMISESMLYTLFSGTGGRHTLELRIPQSEFKAFTFTFG